MVNDSNQDFMELLHDAVKRAARSIGLKGAIFTTLSVSVFEPHTEPPLGYLRMLIIQDEDHKRQLVSHRY